MGISALRVRLVGDFTIPLSEALSEHVEVVAVQMHGVGRYEFVVNYEAHGGVGAEVMDGPSFGVGEVAGIGEGKDGVTAVKVSEWSVGCRVAGCGWAGVDSLEIGTERHVVHVEEEGTSTRCGSVGVGCDDNVFGNRRIASCWEWEVWSRLGKIVLTSVSALAFRAVGKASYIATFVVIVGSGLRLWYCVCVGFFVIDSGQGKGVVGSIAFRTEIRAHPDGRVSWACSRNNDIGTLANTESDHIGSVWLDGHKIVGNDCHVETINGETLNTFGATVDKPESVLLARLELELRKTSVRCARLGLVCDQSAVVVHFAVNQIDVREWR